MNRAERNTEELRRLRYVFSGSNNVGKWRPTLMHRALRPRKRGRSIVTCYNQNSVN